MVVKIKAAMTAKKAKSFTMRFCREEERAVSARARKRDMNLELFQTRSRRCSSVSDLVSKFNTAHGDRPPPMDSLINKGAGKGAGSKAVGSKATGSPGGGSGGLW